MSARRAAIACVLALVGCARPPAPPPSAFDQESCALQMDGDIITRRLEEVRGLRLVKAVTLEVVSEDEFDKRMLAASTPDTSNPSVRAASRLAFGLPKERVPSTHAAGGRDDVLGFYDSKTKSLDIRAGMTTRFGIDALRTTIAHELEHAAQDQAFGVPDFTALSKQLDSDALLARKALVEGDATVAEQLWSAMGVSGVRDAARAVRRRLSAALLDPMDGLSVAYVAGARLVLDVHAVGGFPLVNKMFAAPPRSMEQVLHAEKFLAGELPVPIAPPPLPKGWKSMVRGVLSESWIAEWLGRCSPGFVAVQAASGWGGSEYRVLTGPDRRVAALWTTAWDDEASAIRFERALRQQEPCWATAQPGDAWTIDAHWRAVRSGNVVTFVRGLTEAEAPLPSAMIATVGARAANAAPLGEVPPPPGVNVANDPGATLSGSVLSSADYGVSMDVPNGWEATAGDARLSFRIERAGPAPRAIAGVVVLDAPYADFEKKGVGDRDFVGLPPHAVAFPVADGDKTIVGGRPAVRGRWRVEDHGTIGTIAAEVVSLCGGARSLFVYAFAPTDDDGAALEAFVSSMRIAPAPKCP